jgi:tRNA (adenine22-N1)-methyltransferase
MLQTKLAQAAAHGAGKRQAEFRAARESGAWYGTGWMNMDERRNEVKLSCRLTQIAKLVPAGSRVADIGTDHALLPVFLVQRGQAAFAVAGDNKPGPLRAAQRQVSKAGLEQQISVRLGDGLEVIEPGEVDTVVIAGMGGSAIAGILERGADRLAGVSRLVLQPNVGADAVRSWLFEHGWLLDGELIAAEDGVFYEILTARPEMTEADRTAGAALYAGYAVGPGLELKREMLLMLGPLLVRSGGEPFLAKWEDELEKREKILRGMERAVTPEGEIRRNKLREETNMIREVLRCLRTGKR